MEISSRFWVLYHGDLDKKRIIQNEDEKDNMI